MSDNGASPRHSVSVAAAVIVDGRFLATRRRDNGRWELPGGVLELDEGPHEGVVREVEEETGLVVRPTRLTGVYKNVTRGIVALVFRCDVVGGEAGVSDEVREVRWLTPDEVRESMAEAYAVRLLDALVEGPPAVRLHDGQNLIADAQPAR
ncbi:MAG: mutT-like protein [Gemmatimonadales bacterium]|nr:mutT-like protein [Gemmatimonadales bacterium]